MLRPLKMNMFGSELAKPFSEMPDDFLEAVELSALYYLVEKSIGSRTISTKMGAFIGGAMLYNFMIKRIQSAETSGMGR
tara:strand:+ start:437 stop:673 length:237 start_codon:yes stop_codon:yes gene_type:complete